MHSASRAREAPVFDDDEKPPASTDPVLRADLDRIWRELAAEYGAQRKTARTAGKTSAPKK